MANKFLDKEPYVIVFLTLVTLFAVSMLSVIDAKTRPQIALQKQAKIQAMLKGMYADMTGFTEKDGIYTITGDSGALGWAFTGAGRGYGGAIQLLVGVDSTFAVKEVVIVSHTETPGLGDKVLAESFRGQYRGMITEDVNLKKFGGKVDAITGATISSKAVTDGVRAMMTEKLALIKGQEG